MKFFILTNVYGQNDRFYCDAEMGRQGEGEKRERGEGENRKTGDMGAPGAIIFVDG
jgi:hypothetical protein